MKKIKKQDPNESARGYRDLVRRTPLQRYSMNSAQQEVAEFRKLMKAWNYATVKMVAAQDTGDLTREKIWRVREEKLRLEVWRAGRRFKTIPGLAAVARAHNSDLRVSSYLDESSIVRLINSCLRLLKSKSARDRRPTNVPSRRRLNIRVQSGRSRLMPHSACVTQPKVGSQRRA